MIPFFSTINALLARQTPSQFQRSLWSHASARMKLLIAIHIVVLIGGGLALDAVLRKNGQWMTNVWTFAVFAALLYLGKSTERWTLIICMVLGCLGEMVLSLVWRLYDYQFGNLPLFVPPGHAMLMLLGVLIAQRLDALFYPENTANDTLKNAYFRASWLLGVPVIGLVYAAFVALRGTDTFGAALFVVFLACMVFGRAKTLYVTMFLLALLMELYGTALENWRWAATVPAAIFHPAHSISAANPPFSAGAFYCLLDLIVIGLMTRKTGESKPSAVPTVG
jgi:hypothetical protein